MDQFVDVNSRSLRIQAENEVAVILSNFSTEYIYSAIETSIQNKKLDFTGVEQPNFVCSLEDSFKGMLAQFPFDARNINEIRDRTYGEIISFLCDAHGLEPVYQEDEDKHALAFYLYDLLIAKYDPYFIQLFMNIIYNEKEDIYKFLSAVEAANSKDITTTFNKELYKDDKLAIIAANLNKVMGFIYSMDIPMENILSRLYPDSVMMMLMNHIKPVDSFMKCVFGKTLDNPYLCGKAFVLLKIKLNQDATGGRIPAYGA
jgi:hypothetical protein